MEEKMKRTLMIVGALCLFSISASAQDWAKQRADKSPRHQEWVAVKNGGRAVNSFLVFPEVKNKATAVVVIHEIFGMSDWVRSLTDQLAEAGYIAIAPDLLSGMGPNGGGSSEFDRSGVGQAIQKLPPDQITADLNAVADYVAKLPACNGKRWLGAQGRLSPIFASASLFAERISMFPAGLYYRRGEGRTNRQRESPAFASFSR